MKEIVKALKAAGELCILARERVDDPAFVAQAEITMLVIGRAVDAMLELNEADK